MGRLMSLGSLFRLLLQYLPNSQIPTRWLPKQSRKPRNLAAWKRMGLKRRESGLRMGLPRCLPSLNGKRPAERVQICLHRQSNMLFPIDQKEKFPEIQLFILGIAAEVAHSRLQTTEWMLPGTITEACRAVLPNRQRQSGLEIPESRGITESQPVNYLIGRIDPHEMACVNPLEMVEKGVEI